MWNRLYHLLSPIPTQCIRRIVSSRPVRAALVLFAFAAYALAYPPLHARLGAGVGSLASVPVVLSGWLFGLRGGLLAGLVILPLNTLLLNLAGHRGWEVGLRGTAGFGYLAAVVVGVIVGRWSDLIRMLRASEAELHVRARQMALLNELTRAALERPDLHEMLQTLADRLGELLGADGAYITLWDEAQGRTIPAAAYGELRERYPTIRVEPGEVTMTESVLRAGHVLVVEDVFNTPYLSPRIAALFPTRSMLALPLIADEQKLGAALIAFDQTHHFTPDEVALGEQAARQIALAVARLRLLHETQRLAWEHSRLFEAVRDFSTGLDEQGVLTAVARHMTGALQVAGCTISRYEPEQECIVTLLDYDRASPHLVPVGTTYALVDYPATRRVLESRQPLVVRADDPAADPAERAILELYGYATVLMLPLAAGERVLGLIELSRRPGDPPFSDDDLRLAQSLTGPAAVALDNARLHAEVQALAVTDGLTGVANRRAFDRALEREWTRAQRYRYPLALVILDLDSFKHYNDVYGHLAGDERLRAVARLLQSGVRDLDIVARYGGEEFALIMPHTDKAGALALAERLRAAAEAAYRSFVGDGAPPDDLQSAMGDTPSAPGDQPIPGYTLSIGVAVFPDDAQSPEGLLRAADDAELAAKRAGKNRVCAAPASAAEK